MDLARHDINSLKLLLIIATEATRAFNPITRLEPGETFLGDWRYMGFTSEKVYRRAKKTLLTIGVVNYRKRADGKYIATLANKDLVDINQEKGRMEGGEHRANGGGVLSISRKKEEVKNTPLPPKGVDQDLWDEFLKNRKRVKASNSPQALNTLTNKIDRFVAKGHDANELVATANESGWKTVYEPNTPAVNSKPKSLWHSTDNEIMKMCAARGISTQGKTKQDLIGKLEARP